jgi:hypothetical protein
VPPEKEKETLAGLLGAESFPTFLCTSQCQSRNNAIFSIPQAEFKVKAFVILVSQNTQVEKFA